MFNLLDNSLIPPLRGKRASTPRKKRLEEKTTRKPKKKRIEAERAKSPATTRETDALIGDEEQNGKQKKE